MKSVNTTDEENTVSNHNHATDDQDFEITLVVGSLFTSTPQEDPEEFAEERENLSQLQDVLREQGVVVDLLSNPGLVLWEGGIRSYGDLYRLRQIAAHLEQGTEIASLLKRKPDADEEVDPVLAAIFSEEMPTQFPHLIKHTGENGYYIPVEFANPIWIEEEEEEDEEAAFDAEDDEYTGEIIAFGSSSALQRELHMLQGYLQQFNVPANHPVMRCLQALRTAADLSVQNGLPIVVW